MPAAEGQSRAVAVPRDASRLRNVGELFLVTVAASTVRAAESSAPPELASDQLAGFSVNRGRGLL